METSHAIPSEPALIQRASDLKVLPMVANKVMETVERESASSAELGRVIETDKALTSRVLKIANSSFYGLRSEVTDLSHAVAVLGFNAVRNLVVAASTKGLHVNFGITEKMMWEHSIGAAVGARLLCRGKTRELQDVAFIGGLLHDIGKVVMNNVTPHAYADVLSAVYNDGRPALECEEHVYGYGHPSVGAGVLEKWGFPEMLSQIVRFHHADDTTLESLGDPFVARAIRAVSYADYICRFHGIGYRAPEPSLDLSALSGCILPDGQDIPSLAAEIQGAYESARASFD